MCRSMKINSLLIFKIGESQRIMNGIRFGFSFGRSSIAINQEQTWSIALHAIAFVTHHYFGETGVRVFNSNKYDKFLSIFFSFFASKRFVIFWLFMFFHSMMGLNNRIYQNNRSSCGCSTCLVRWIGVNAIEIDSSLNIHLGNQMAMKSIIHEKAIQFLQQFASQTDLCSSIYAYSNYTFL